jgi:hypothetical protein
MSEAALKSLQHLDDGFAIDDETEDERLFYEDPAAF